MDLANEGQEFSNAVISPANTRIIMRQLIARIIEHRLGHVLGRFHVRGPKAKKALINAIEDSMYLEAQDMESYTDLTSLERKVLHFAEELIIRNIRAEQARAAQQKAMQIRSLQMMRALDLNRNQQLGLFQRQR